MQEPFHMKLCLTWETLVNYCSYFTGLQTDIWETFILTPSRGHVWTRTRGCQVPSLAGLTVTARDIRIHEKYKDLWKTDYGSEFLMLKKSLFRLSNWLILTVLAKQIHGTCKKNFFLVLGTELQLQCFAIKFFIHNINLLPETMKIQAVQWQSMEIAVVSAKLRIEVAKVDSEKGVKPSYVNRVINA